MSFDLELQLKSPMEVHDVTSRVTLALSELLDSLVEDGWIALAQHPSENSNTTISPPFHALVSVFDVHPVELMATRYADELEKYLLPNAYSVSDEDFEPIAEISVRAAEPLKWALGAACAIALGREDQSDIMNESLFWSNTHQQNADNFIQAIKQQKADELAKAREILSAHSQRNTF